MKTKALRVGAALGSVVVGVSLAGFFHATLPTHYETTDPLHHAEEPLVAPGAPQARTYKQMRDRPSSAIGITRALEKLEAVVPPRSESTKANTSKQEALVERSLLRAYDGAPPVIPHPVSQTDANQCLACHVKGLKFGALRAPSLPHKKYVSCTQCHALGVPNAPWGTRSEGLKPDPRAVANSFTGLKPSTEGPRWSQQSPPIVAHGTFMHEQCISCHGPNGRDALRSSHPQRQSCLQCHATQASLEQRPGGRGLELLP